MILSDKRIAIATKPIVVVSKNTGMVWHLDADEYQLFMRGRRREFYRKFYIEE